MGLNIIGRVLKSYRQTTGQIQKFAPLTLRKPAYVGRNVRRNMPPGFERQRMKSKKIAPLIIILILNILSDGQTVLTNPIGARSLAMGRTGYTISSDGTALFFNPAILGLENFRWNKGEIQYYREPMIIDIVKSYYSINWQQDEIKNMGFSLYLNHIAAGEINEIDMNGSIVDTWYSYDYVIAAGAGYCFYKKSFLSNSVGVGLKYYRSPMGTKNDGEKYYGHAFSFDAGYLLQLFDRLRLGFVIKNIGTDIKWKDKDSTLSNNSQPSLIGIGTGYIDDYYYGKLKLLKLSTELSYRKVFGDSHLKNNGNILTGIELFFLGTFPIRVGYQRILKGNEEGINGISFGTGLSLFNHFNFDIFWSFDDDEYDIDEPNYGFSVSITRALNWSKKDKRWWIKY
ncbi:MAG: PorV/PorQ family protein [Chitinivibrionales bacterium]|nr:PorV/PorQ family protein [Chitinivibrionales bacterium]